MNIFSAVRASGRFASASHDSRKCVSELAETTRPPQVGGLFGGGNGASATAATTAKKKAPEPEPDDDVLVEKEGVSAAGTYQVIVKARATANRRSPSLTFPRPPPTPTPVPERNPLVPVLMLAPSSPRAPCARAPGRLLPFLSTASQSPVSGAALLYPNAQRHSHTHARAPCADHRGEGPVRDPALRHPAAAHEHRLAGPSAHAIRPRQGAAPPQHTHTHAHNPRTLRRADAVSARPTARACARAPLCGVSLARATPLCRASGSA